MILSDYIEAEILHIGSKSAFFFVGTRDEWLRDKDVIEDRYRRMFHDYAVDVEKRYKDLVMNPESFKKSKADQIKKAYYEALNITKNFKSFDDREILNIYPLNGGTAVILEGWEVGNCYNRHDYLIRNTDVSMLETNRIKKCPICGKYPNIVNTTENRLRIFCPTGHLMTAEANDQQAALGFWNMLTKNNEEHLLNHDELTEGIMRSTATRFRFLEEKKQKKESYDIVEYDDILKFFKSSWFEKLTGLDGDVIVKTLKKHVAEDLKEGGNS